MSDSQGQGGNADEASSTGDSDHPPPPADGGSGYPPPPSVGGSGYPPPPQVGGSGYPSPGGQQYPAGGQGGYPVPGGYPPAAGQGYQGYPPPPGQGGYPPPPGGQPYPGGGPGGYPGGAWDSERPRGWSGLAIAAFIVGLVVPCIGVVVAIPMGIVALVQIRKSGDKGKVFAILGIVIPVLWLAAAGGFIAWIATSTAERDSTGQIVEAGRIDYGDLREGDCVNIDGLEDDAEVDPFDLEGVPCSDEHNAEVAGVVELEGGDDYPGEPEVRLQAIAGCQRLIPGLPAELDIYPLYPTDSLWTDDSDTQQAICFAVQPDYSDFSGKQLN